MTTMQVQPDQRETFYRLVPELMLADDRLALVLAEIGKDYLNLPTASADRVVNVGIREQLMIGAAAGLALAGLRPVVHSFAPFLLERPFEQVKLDLDHQGLGAVLVSAAASYNWPEGGQTHFGPRDVALLDTLSGWTVHTPGHPQEVDVLLRRAVTGDARVYIRLDGTSNAEPRAADTDAMSVLRHGSEATVVAFGPVLDRVLAATGDLDVTVLYAATARPFDAQAVRSSLGAPAVVLVEPWLRGTSAHLVADALVDVPHRLLCLGVDRTEHRRYGTVADHDRLHGLDIAGLHRSIVGFVSA